MKMTALKTSMAFLMVAWILSGCANSSKKNGGLGGANEGSLPGETDVLGSQAAPRPEGINPDKDVDYSILAEDTVYFAFDSSAISSSEKGKLEKVAEWLKSNPDRSLFLAGHTDKRGTPEYNRGLGERRAQAVREYLIGSGIDGGRLNTISYGEERPADTGDSEAAYAKNRRVEVGVIKK